MLLREVLFGIKEHSIHESWKPLRIYFQNAKWPTFAFVLSPLLSLQSSQLDP